jgi:hypothetical protein
LTIISVFLVDDKLGHGQHFTIKLITKKNKEKQDALKKHFSSIPEYSIEIVDRAIDSLLILKNVSSFTNLTTALLDIIQIKDLL